LTFSDRPIIAGELGSLRDIKEDHGAAEHFRSGREKLAHREQLDRMVG